MGLGKGASSLQAAVMEKLPGKLLTLENGRFDAACGQLADFQAEVAEKVADGALSAAEGDTLTAAAEAIRAAIGCGGSF